MDPTDEQLRSWLTRPEDQFIERKTSSDSGDWVKTVVAFANSTPHDRCCVLYIGVRHDGSVLDMGDLDSLQRTLRQKLEAVFPKVEYTTRVLDVDSRRCLCVIVPGGRVIIGAYGSRTKNQPAFDVAGFLQDAGFRVAGGVSVGNVPEARFAWLTAHASSGPDAA